MAAVQQCITVRFEHRNKCFKESHFHSYVARITGIVAPLDAAGNNFHGKKKAFLNFLKRQRVYYALPSFIK